MFAWQNFWVRSIKFDYRTQSKSIERLELDWVRNTESSISLGQSTGLRVPIAKTAKNMTETDLPTRANIKRIFVTFEFRNKSHFFICLLFPFLVKSILLDLLSAQGGPFNSSISDQR